MSRKIKRRVNRKQIQRICRKTGLIAPITTKKEAVKHGSRKVVASRPYEVWEVDITYIPAGESWAYCYTVLDVFTREWVGYALSTSATATVAVEALLDALHRHPDADPAGRVCGQMEGGALMTGGAYIFSKKVVKIHGVQLIVSE